MKKKKLDNINIKHKDGFIEVPTYLFPEANEYSKEVIPEYKLDNEKEED